MATETIVRKVQNLVNPEQSWCVQWQTAIMRAPAFWYYETETEARAVADSFLGRA